jgi:hypothetical protein
MPATHGKALGAVSAVDALVVHLEALSAQQDVQSAIAEARPACGVLAQPRAQLGAVRPPAAIAPRGTRKAQRSAGPTLAEPNSSSMNAAAARRADGVTIFLPAPP